jgi:surface carbohydrate biosynthesis protein
LAAVLPNRYGIGSGDQDIIILDFFEHSEADPSMPTIKPALLIPVENQVRELDAKLLLACVAANRGLHSIIGPKREIEFRIASFPRSIFLSKSLRIGNRKFFPTARQLGHEIVAWDEEALVHLPAEIYFSRRLSPKGMANVSHLFAWGEDNAAMWRQYPQLPQGLPIHVTGNPRNDLLRDEMRAFYEDEIRQIREAYRPFVLINTNFNHVNAYHPTQNLFQTGTPGTDPVFGQAARGMPQDYAEGLQAHKKAIFEDFIEMIPAIENAFPDVDIVVRPHPTENQSVYHQIASRCQRVHVTNAGNVVPWLKTARVLIHNGCTTGVEAYVMGVPAISYRASVNDFYDDGFYQLPNRLSRQCFDLASLKATLKPIIEGHRVADDDTERQALVEHHLAGLAGPLACERIVDVLWGVIADLGRQKDPSPRDRLAGWVRTTKRRIRQRIKSHLPGSSKSPAFERHRFPEMALEEISARLTRFQSILAYPRPLRVERVFGKLFRISA